MVKDKPTAERPPIIIEFQYKISRDFMNRVISYSLSAYCRYKAYPVVLIFAIKEFLSVDIEKEFSCGDESPFLKIESKFWAKDCLLISQSSIDKFLSRSPIKPIVALGYYLIAGSLSLDSLGYQLDPTVKLLYQISKDLVMKELLPKNKSVKYMQLFLEKIKRQLDHVADEDKNTRNLVVKKIKECVNESLELISEQNEFLTTNSGQGEIKDNKCTEQDILFIESNSTVGKNKNWKQIFDKGKAEGFFKSYSSSHTLKTYYWHYRRRTKI